MIGESFVQRGLSIKRGAGNTKFRSIMTINRFKQKGRPEDRP
jgi:hypothetical protein